GLVETFKHFFNRGHNGRVTCVDASAAADFIVSGGVDYTVRVWKYDIVHSSYDLFAILEQTPPVPLKAVLCLLDAAYELGDERPIPHAALADVLRVSQMFQVRQLEEKAVKSLAMEITSENFLERLDLCVEFNLIFLYERILRHLHKQGKLLEVCRCEEIVCYPRLMQHMVLYLSTHDLK
ncbi:unnamed protein product, partial [Symbiodinium sp. CCMP2456]